MVTTSLAHTGDVRFRMYLLDLMVDLGRRLERSYLFKAVIDLDVDVVVNDRTRGNLSILKGNCGSLRLLVGL